MNARSTETSAARRIAPVYAIVSGQIQLAAPIEDAWRHVINYTSWQNYTIAAQISGQRGQEGEVVLLKKEEPGFTFPPYRARTIKLEPPHVVIWKTYPDDDKGEFEYFGIVEFRLNEDDGNTRFSYQLLYEYLVPYQEEAELVTFRKRQFENLSGMLSQIMTKLQKLVEQRPR